MPSGCGKTTLLNSLANRPTNKATLAGDVKANIETISPSDFRKMSSSFEQEDALIGKLHLIALYYTVLVFFELHVY